MGRWVGFWSCADELIFAESCIAGILMSLSRVLVCSGVCAMQGAMHQQIAAVMSRTYLVAATCVRL